MRRFAFFDGDNIGNTLDNLFNSGRIDDAKHLSESIKRAIFQIETLVRATDGAELIIAGGDDVLVKFDSEKSGPEYLQAISDLFTKYTGLSMSCGVGNNLNQAIGNLMLAKQNKGTTKYPTEKEELESTRLKPKKLLMFATSDNPDPYVNVIVHCSDHHKPLTEIVLIGITGDRGRVGLIKHYLKNLQESITKQIDCLSNGCYLEKEESGWEPKELKLEMPHRQRYDKVKGIKFDNKPIIYDELEDEISTLLNSTDSYAFIFDVTAVLKRHLVDVYNILRFKNVSSIYSFEFLYSPKHSHKDLIHNLIYKETYDYTSLANSIYTKDKIIMTDESIISSIEFNKMASTLNALQIEREYLEDKIATIFARRVFIGISFLWVVAIVGFYRLILKPEGWNWLEPRYSLLLLIWAAINYILPGLFADKAIIIDPRKFVRVLKERKKKRLEASRIVEDKSLT
ncbi:MAG: hypothetical protein DMF61_13030 [Blastocatellia bacterium AA13]|nr:MAG: hypothetical protein DMF61_13030 [Blastocatellia bacterium AA13]